ncbi:trafficking protein particle complex subunit 8 [Cucumis melo var. makuwa]|uniref:Trafficking protein particle complex subunit 8 n=1 Tax=Cucumis melo var. makuwa TaxID=1194695 RepID=A0A5D3DNX0_CUCMM|nr:trafficking protein particle complex subunit 8 [Cucumis melo var. makuwa]
MSNVVLKVAWLSHPIAGFCGVVLRDAFFWRIGSPRASKMLTEMRSTFGSNDCQLLCINSSHDGHIERQDDPWSLFKPDASIGKQLGCFLSNEDLIEIRELMQNLSSKHIIPYMEQKIRELNQQVSATRKGFRNQIKNLWWRKGKDDAVDSPNGPTYTYNSIESQIRVLGDYAFMLRDYELALSNYRLISTDYKLDKAWKRYAGVQALVAVFSIAVAQSAESPAPPSLWLLRLTLPSSTYCLCWCSHCSPLWICTQGLNLTLMIFHMHFCDFGHGFSY